MYTPTHIQCCRLEEAGDCGRQPSTRKRFLITFTQCQRWRDWMWVGVCRAARHIVNASFTNTPCLLPREDNHLQPVFADQVWEPFLLELGECVIPLPKETSSTLSSVWGLIWLFTNLLHSFPAGPGWGQVGLVCFMLFPSSHLAGWQRDLWSEGNWVVQTNTWVKVQSVEEGLTGTYEWLNSNPRTNNHSASCRRVKSSCTGLFWSVLKHFKRTWC